MGYSKLMNDKCRVSFFVLGYLSLSHPILVPIQISAMQLVSQKSCLAQRWPQPNDCYISLPTAHAVLIRFTEHLYYKCIQVLQPFPRHASLGEAARADPGRRPAGARFEAPPPQRPTCTAGRGVGALLSASPRRLRHRRGGCRAEAVAKAAVAEARRSYEI
jgi:hypothetical protein